MVLSDDHSDLFIFALPGGKRPTTARKAHICRLNDILHLCLLRQDLPRARRAWAILARCKEVNWKLMWKTGLALLGGQEVNDSVEQDDARLEYLATMMLQHSESRESILQEMVLNLILSEKYVKALEELELYLPSPPYEDNSTLHIYASLLCIYLAQPDASKAQQGPQGDKTATWDETRVRQAQQYLDRAVALDPTDIVAKAWLEKLPLLTKPQARGGSPDSDDERMTLDGETDGERHKRARTTPA